jgi:hypothetical protein
MLNTATPVVRPSLRELYTGERPYRMHRWDHYIPIYERHFGRFRDRPIRLLEIGIQYGGGLYMWHRYFHPASSIHGVDINPACIVPDCHNISYSIGDSADPYFWEELLPKIGPLDIVIDDGGHTMDQQISAFVSIYPTMANDGVYLVEDTHTSLWGGDFHDWKGIDPHYTFMEKAHGDTLRLMEWSGNPDSFGILMSDRRGELDESVSEFCRTTAGIHFYGSIVVYERGERLAPAHGLR